VNGIQIGQASVGGDRENSNQFACAAWLVALWPCWAGKPAAHFLEFPDDVDTTTFDLNTAQVIQPGRFSFVRTTIDNPDVMKLELKVLGTRRTYCMRLDGKYPTLADLLTLGPPNMPVKSIEKKRIVVSWD
jgi:hypothetical protein